MNYPAASSGVSTKDAINFIVASDGVLDPQLRNKSLLPPLRTIRSKLLLGSSLVPLRLLTR